MKKSESAPYLPGEFELIDEFFAPLSREFPGAFGLLDDAAVIAPAEGNELVVTSDALVGGVHFLPADPPALVARKALRVNLSDLAAKGAVPRAYLLDLVLPRTVSRDWLSGFSAGLAADQAEFNIHLIGGDTNATSGPLTIAVVALGEVPAGAMLQRSGAQIDDLIWVTGTVGDAALGLMALRGGLQKNIRADDTASLVDRYRLPRPRVTVGPALLGIATAAIDISDGLIADLRHICATSGACGVIEAAKLPFSSPLRDALEANHGLLSAAIRGGDDYEILFTAPADAARVSDLPCMSDLVHASAKGSTNDNFQRTAGRTFRRL